MALAASIVKILTRRYEPGILVEMRHKGLDIAFKTDASGDPILLFIGERNERGAVIGQRYTRTLKFDAQGCKIKDHWELKGRAT